ncbi:hypothetical protein J6590_072977 [Homalodisca vitripennis]|nr:hypothetical protein J6590_072977 [Homalodisca vitripennis]
MGRVKLGKKIRNNLNRKSVSKRWDAYKNSDVGNKNTSFGIPNVEIQSMPQIDYDNVRPGPSNEAMSIEISLPVSQEQTDCCDENMPVRKKSTGFELVSSYKPQIEVSDENAPVYCLIDLAVLANFLEEMPCKNKDTLRPTRIHG